MELINERLVVGHTWTWIDGLTMFSSSLVPGRISCMVKITTCGFCGGNIGILCSVLFFSWLLFVSIYVYIKSIQIWVADMYVCMYVCVCVYVCMYVCMHVCVCIGNRLPWLI